MSGSERASIVCAGLLAVCAPGYGCKRDRPEDEVRALLQRGAEAVEQRDIGRVMGFVADDFEGTQGMTKDELRGLLFAHLRGSVWRRVFLVDTRISVMNANLVEVKTGAVLAKGEAIQKLEDVLPSNAGTYRFELRFVQKDGQWKIDQASHQQVQLTDFLQPP